MADNSPAGLISAIAELWKLVAAGAVVCFLFLYRKSLAEFLPKLKKLKRGSTEIELQDQAQISPEAAKPGIQATPPEKSVTIPEPKTSEEPPWFPIFQAFLNRDSDQAERLFQELLQKDPEKKRDHEVFYFT